MINTQSFPKISIVTPVYNGAKYLEECILSVINQGYPNLEYIIIDGGSTDDSIDIIQRYSKHLAYWVSEPDKGMYDAIQKGFNHSTGEIMAWLGADDKYHAKSLFTIADVFGTFPEVNWLSGAGTLYSEQGQSVWVGGTRAFSRLDFLMGDYKWISQESTFWRRCLWDKAGGLNTSKHYAGEFDLWLRFFRTDRLYTVDALIGGFRVRGDGQLSHDHMDDYFKEVAESLNAEQISPREKQIIKRYKAILKLEEILFSSRIFATNKLKKRFRRKYFNLTPQIKYDFTKQRFIYGATIYC